jgi:hypothetical protein
MAGGRDISKGRDAASVGVAVEGHDQAVYRTTWLCEKWGEDKVEFARKELKKQGIERLQDGVKVVGHEPIWQREWWLNEDEEMIFGENFVIVGHREVVVPRFITLEHGITSEALRSLGLEPDEIEFVEGNLLLNEGIGRVWDLAIAAGGTAFNNANAFIGVGDTATAEAASQTELLATQNAANRFYKGMVASYPQRTNQTVDWRSDFTSTEANFAWQEWTIAAGATTASGSGFLVGTINLNRKVQSLGTKTTGTWTMTGSVTLA